MNALINTFKNGKFITEKVRVLDIFEKDGIKLFMHKKNIDKKPFFFYREFFTGTEFVKNPHLSDALYWVDRYIEEERELIIHQTEKLIEEHGFVNSEEQWKLLIGLYPQAMRDYA